MPSRRGFLRKTLGAVWTGAGLLEQSMFRANLARAQATPALPDLFDIEKVADGIYAAIAKPAVLINCNAAIFENDRDLLIVDTHSKPSAVTSLVSQIRRKLTDKPVRYVVNSHFHWDHTQGAPAYRRIAPHADIVSSEATRRLLAENGAARLKASVDESEKAVATYKEKLGAAKTDAEKSYWRRMQVDTRDYLSEMRNYTPELPNVTFERDLIIHDKAHDLHLAFRGRGHTGGDIVVFCPQKKVVATGDLLHGNFPFLADGYPLEWPRTLHGVAELQFQQVIGGHGGVQPTRDRLYQMAYYIEDLTETVVKAKKAGRTPAEIVKQTPPSSVRSLARGGYAKFLGDSLLRHRMVAPGTTAEQLITESVATNITHIYSALERS